MKVIIVMLSIMAFSCQINSQTPQTTTIGFCASVESNGYCNFNNTKFIAAKDSATAKIFMQLRGENNPIGTTKVTFKIYSVDKTGVEKMLKSIEQDIQPDWQFAWTPYSFKSGGKYNVKVYNAVDKLLCAKSFELFSF